MSAPEQAVSTVTDEQLIKMRQFLMSGNDTQPILAAYVALGHRDEYLSEQPQGERPGGGQATDFDTDQAACAIDMVIAEHSSLAEKRVLLSRKRLYRVYRAYKEVCERDVAEGQVVDG